MKTLDFVMNRNTCSITQLVEGNIVASFSRSDGDYTAAISDTTVQVVALLNTMDQYPSFRTTITALSQEDIDAYYELAASAADAEVHDSEQ